MADSSDGWVGGLSRELFGDVGQYRISAGQQLKWIVERVVERGTWEDWILLNRNVSRSQLVSLFPHLKLPPREVAFLRAHLGIDDETLAKIISTGSARGPQK